MFDLSVIRTRLHDIMVGVNGGELNVYSWPEPQPEYPCVTFMWPDEIDYHLAAARQLSALTLRLTVMVASADVSEAAAQLDQYANPDGTRSLLKALEDADPQGAWSILVFTRAANWRQIIDVDGLAYDVELTVHA